MPTPAIELEVGGRTVRVTSPDKVYFPEIGLTKREVVEYVLAVGDGANDLPMLRLAGTGVALHAKPVVSAQVPVRVNHGDLTAALFLQGYAVSDLVHPG